MKTLLFAALLLLSSIPALAAFPAATTVPNQARVEFAKGEIRTSDTFKLALFTQAGASYNTSTTSNTTTTFSATGEVSGTGYSRVTLAGCAVTLTGSEARLTCTSPSWGPTATITADAAVIYDDTCDGATRCANADQVIGLFPFASTTSTSSTFNLTLPANLFVLQ